MLSPTTVQPPQEKEAQALTPIQRTGLWLGGFSAVTAAVVIIWGTALEFPVDVGGDIADWVNDGIRYITIKGGFFFDSIADVVFTFLLLLEDILIWIPWPSLIFGIGLISWRMVGWKVALFAVAALLGTGAVGLWPSAMETTALIMVSVIISISIAVPIGPIGWFFAPDSSQYLCRR